MKSGTFSKQNFMTIVVLFSILTGLINICLKRRRMEPHAVSSLNLSICHEVGMKRQGLRPVIKELPFCWSRFWEWLALVIQLAWGFLSPDFRPCWLACAVPDRLQWWKGVLLPTVYLAPRNREARCPFLCLTKTQGPFWPQCFKRWREGKALASNPSAMWETSNHIPGYSDQWHTEATGLR